VIDTRRYQWMIGIFGLALVIVISVSFLTTHTIGPPGVAAGNRLHHFAAPLAGSTLEGDANLKPPCSAAHHDPRALNTCLLVSRAPLVLAFFTTNSGTCIQQVDTLQTVSRQFPGRAVQFAAVAVRASHRKAAALVRSHRWTIPVAYDRDGAVGALYGVEVCPMLELAHRGGVVAARLFGSHWLGRAALSARVQALVGG
jgi:peroxiredoxin